MLAQTSKKFGVLPSARLGLVDAGLCVDFDNALALRLILAAGDLDEDEWEDVPVGQPRGNTARARTETIYW